MNKTLRELFNQINGKRAEITALIEADKMDEAEQAKTELQALQNKFNMLAEIADVIEDKAEIVLPGKEITAPDNLKPVEEPKDAIHEFANAARSYFALSKEGTGADGGYTVPEDIQTRINEYKESFDRLETLVSVETVKAPTGARTYKKRGQHTGFATTAEANKVGAKEGPQFARVEYKVEKRSGYLPVTAELLEDSDANISATLIEWLGDEDIATKNKLVLDKVATFEETDLKNLDGIKKAINVTLGAKFAGAVTIVTNDDGLQYLDTLKDAQGRYILSPSVQDPMQMVVAVGARKIPLQVVSNDTMATDDTKVPFVIGDFKSAIKIFERKGITVTTSTEASVGDINAFEEDVTLLKGSERNDCRVIDDKALVNGYITVTGN